jgi:hypothetical protein
MARRAELEDDLLDFSIEPVARARQPNDPNQRVVRPARRIDASAGNSVFQDGTRRNTVATCSGLPGIAMRP